jgi:hypothetical protein
MRSLMRKIVLAAACIAAMALAACGGLSSGLTTSGTPEHSYGTVIAPGEPISAVFLRPLNPNTVTNGISVTADGIPVTFTTALQDNGYKLTIIPDGEWPAGATLVVRLAGGVAGIHYTDGRTFSTIELVYYVEQQ